MTPYRVTLTNDGARRVVVVNAEDASDAEIVAEETLGEDEAGWVVDHAEPVND